MNPPNRDHYPYQARYREENIWHLCQRLEFRGSDVLVIAAKGKFFPILCQRAAESPDGFLLWDYHVVLLWHGGQGAHSILDFDTTLPFCSLAEEYFRQLFMDERRLEPALSSPRPQSIRFPQRNSTPAHPSPPEWPRQGSTVCAKLYPASDSNIGVSNARYCAPEPSQGSTPMIRTPAVTLLAFGLASASFADDPFTLQSPDITDGKAMAKAQEFSGGGCDGGNHSPALSWTGTPEGTKSFALTVYDPDAPTGSGWWHWLVFNIPADTTSLPADIDATGKGLPEGATQSLTDFGKPGFGGACPPQGDKPHHYHFTLYALKTDKLDLTPDTMPAKVGFMLHANSIGQAGLVTTYQR